MQLLHNPVKTTIAERVIHFKLMVNTNVLKLYLYIDVSVELAKDCSIAEKKQRWVFEVLKLLQAK